jgi:hypothetical protein
MELRIDEDGPWLDLQTKDGARASINLRRYAEEKNDPIILQWCEEKSGRPLQRRLQVVAEKEQGS